MKEETLRIGYSHTYLCGHLNTSKSADEVESSDSRWEREILEEAEYRNIGNFYYESFVDSLFEVKQHKQHGVYGGTAHLTMKLDMPCKLNHAKLGKDGWEFTVSQLHLFFFPYDIRLFAIEIEETENCDPNRLTQAHLLLRDVNCYEEITDQGRTLLDAPQYIEAIQPLLKICEIIDDRGEVTHKPQYSDLVRTGNKLKAFQIIGANEFSDELLFELGTMSRIGCVNDHTQPDSPSTSYFNEIISNNTISAFQNWKALALFDTFTIIRKDGNAGGLWLWRDSYFRLIYIHALYQKTLLFVVNNLFRSDAANGECATLLQQMKEQEHWYAFTNISYNFLPQIIYNAIDRGLEIASEREQLHHYLVQEAERQESLRERHIGKLLTALTLLAVLSALYDGTSLIREVAGFETGSCPHKWIAGGFSIVVVLIFLIWLLTYYRRKKQNRL